MLSQGEFPYQLFRSLSQSLWVTFWAVCTVPKEGDVVSRLFHQGIEHRLSSEENVAANCTCFSRRVAWFVSSWSQALAHWYWEGTGVPRVTAEHRLCEMTQWEEIKNQNKTKILTNDTKLYAEKEKEKTKQLAPVILIETLSAVVAIAKHDNRTRTHEFRNV